ncbi:MAG TPA: transcriptional regulator [Chromatiales bacterium]|nr:transcriptional regulator [Chromatiales bacterium]
MRTVIETPLFSRLQADYWTEAEREAFVAWIAAQPRAGKVIPGSGGLRKVRWSAPGRGKRGGVRIIYIDRPARGELWLLLIYSKQVADDLPVRTLRRLREMLEEADE